MKSIVFKSVIYKEGRYFVAQCLDVDVSSFGKTEKEAKGNLHEALELYFEDKQISKIKHVSSAKVVPLTLQHA